MAEDIPKDIQQFLWRIVDSIMQLEVLLLLRTQPQRFWTSSDLARELRIDPAGAKQQIIPLVERGVIRAQTPDGNSFAYGALSPQDDAMIEAIARHYVERRVTVVTLIYSRPLDQSNDPARRFAEAFRLRPPDNK